MGWSSYSPQRRLRKDLCISEPCWLRPTIGIASAKPIRSTCRCRKSFCQCCGAAACRASCTLNCWYRPLYLTSWLLNDFLNENHLFGASHVLITSASSKTSYGFAHTLRNCGRAVQVCHLSPSPSPSASPCISLSYMWCCSSWGSLCVAAAPGTHF